MNTITDKNPSSTNASSAEHERIAEIEAELRAYREGWVQFDREHVRHLQRERAALLRSATADLLEREEIEPGERPDRPCDPDCARRFIASAECTCSRADATPCEPFDVMRAAAGKGGAS